MRDTPQAPRPLRAALYARVSTQEQTPENQLLALHAFAQARGWTPAEYVDHDVSGARERRPALDPLLADVRRRKRGEYDPTPIHGRAYIEQGQNGS